MSTMSLPHPPACEKPEPPPIVTMLRQVQEAVAARDRIAAENLRALSRALEGRE